MAAAKNKPAKAARASAQLPVPEGWTSQELHAVRDQVVAHNQELHAVLASLRADLVHLAADAATATGDDQADTGSRAFQQFQDEQVAGNARDLLDQNERALGRMESGTYGVCEACGNPIAKGRLQAHPSATLCVTCKSKQERR